MTLALARDPEHSDRQGAGASHPAAARGGALSGHTLRPSNPGGGAEEGVVLWQQVRPEADGLGRAQQRWLREELVSFSAFVHESSGSARGPGPESSAASPARGGRTASALQPALLTARVPEAFPLFLTSPLPRPPSPGTVSYPVPGGCCSVPAARCSAAPATKFLSSSCRLCPRPRRLGLRSDPHPQSFLSPVANVAPADLPGGYCEGSVNQQRPGARFARQASNLTGRNFGRDRTAGGCPVGFTF